MFSTIEITLAISGLLLNGLMRMQSVKAARRSFSFRKWFEDNYLYVFSAIISCFVVLILKDDLCSALGINAEPDAFFYKTYAFLAGYIPHIFIYQLKDKIERHGLGKGDEARESPPPANP